MPTDANSAMNFRTHRYFHTLQRRHRRMALYYIQACRTIHRFGWPAIHFDSERPVFLALSWHLLPRPDIPKPSGECHCREEELIIKCSGIHAFLYAYIDVPDKYTDCHAYHMRSCTLHVDSHLPLMLVPEWPLLMRTRDMLEE